MPCLAGQVVKYWRCSVTLLGDSKMKPFNVLMMCMAFLPQCISKTWLTWWMVHQNYLFWKRLLTFGFTFWPNTEHAPRSPGWMQLNPISHRLGILSLYAFYEHLILSLEKAESSVCFMQIQKQGYSISNSTGPGKKISWARNFFSHQ